MTAGIELDATNTGLVNALKESNKEFLKQRKVMNENARESQRLERIARKAFNDTRTDAERLTAEMEDVGAAFKSGALDAQTYTRRMNQLKMQLRDVDGAQRELAEANKSVFGQASISNLAAFAGSLISINGLIQDMISGFKVLEDQQDALAAGIQGRAGPRGQLVQVAEDEADLAGLRAVSRELAAVGAVADGTAADLATFALRSTGLEEFTDLFTRIGQAGIVDAPLENVINSFDSLFDAFGRTDIESAEQLGDQLLSISKATQQGLQDIGLAAAQSGSILAQAGVRFEEGAAAIAVLADEQGGVERARTRIEALTAALNKRDLIQDGDLEASVLAVRERQAAGERLGDIIGDDKEVISGFSSLNKRLGEFRDVVERADASQGTLNRAIELGLADPVQQAIVAQRGAESRRAAALQEEGVAGLRRQAVIDELITILRESDQRISPGRLARIEASLEDPGFIARSGQAVTGVDPVERQLLSERRIAAIGGDTETVSRLDGLIAELRKQNNRQDKAPVGQNEAGPQ